MTSFSSTDKAGRTRRLTVGRRISGLVRDCRGVAALEFGILLPFMIVLLVGIADLGRSIWQNHALSKGARDAARYLSRVDVQAGNTIDSAHLTAAKNLLLRGSYTSALRPYNFGHWATSVTTNLDAPNTNLVTGYDNTSCTLRGACVDENTTGGIKIITVTATVNPPASEFPLLSAFGLGTIRYSARHQVRNIGE